MPCDRGITRAILETLIESKVKRLFEIKNIKLARLFHCMTRWWTRAPNLVSKQRCQSLSELRSQLEWNDRQDGNSVESPWLDRDGVSILLYVYNFSLSLSLSLSL